MVLFPDSFDAQETLSAIQQHSVTHYVAVPSVLAVLVTIPGCQAAFSKLQHVVSSGEALSSRVAASVQAVLPDTASLWNIYGCAETTADAMASPVPPQHGVLTDHVTRAIVAHLCRWSLARVDMPMHLAICRICVPARR